MRRVKEDMDSGSDAEGIVQCTLKLHDHLSCIQYKATKVLAKYRY